MYEPPPSSEAALNQSGQSSCSANPETDAVCLENAAVRVVVSPRCGGKLTSLFDKRTQTEWLWFNPQLPVREAQYGESYVERLDSGGWDEIFPSVQPCRARLADGDEAGVPDHGDLVQLPWEVLEAGSEHLDMACRGRCLPFDFYRRMQLSGGEMRIDYRVKNTGRVAYPWIWCTHPLLPLDAIASVEVDADFKVLGGESGGVGLIGSTLRWDQLPPASASWAVKLFSAPRATDTIRVRHKNGASLRLGWDVEENPYLALWVNNGGWAGTGGEPYFNLGVEPTNAPDDDLTACKKPPVLKAGETAEWSLAVDVSGS